METATAAELRQKDCAPCDQIPRLSREEIDTLLVDLPEWSLTDDGERIQRKWEVKDFMAAIAFFKRVAKIAEEQNHHPDLHLVNYRNLAIELSTHAIGGISQNDFILAAKIDELPIKEKKKK